MNISITSVTDDQKLKVGNFAFASNKLGLGKIIFISPSSIELEYFESISSQKSYSFSPSDIKGVRVSPQTRCYIRKDDNWRVGRVQKTLDDLVEVDFPERQSEFIPIEEVFVRCSVPLDNPTDVLVHWGHETVFFYERRKKILQGLLLQRGASGGMNGLLSSSIKLYPYQIRAAKKVLEDPVPRYLLADEVGLGKTIEAGIIIRQVLLDHEGAIVLVITPSSLQGQWERELISKFHINQWQEQVEFCIMENIPDLDLGKCYDLIVIDEAHHLAKWHFSEFPSSKRNFAICQSLTSKCTGLLLLSATPALHNEESFLCMLNLLDPAHFAIDNIEDFRYLMNKREEIGKILFLLKEDGQDVIIRSALGNLKKLFFSDNEIAPLLHELEKYYSEKKHRC